MTRVFLLCWLTLLSPASIAHEVLHAVSAQSAVSVRLTFADGQPFAFEAFEVYAAGADKPQAVGRTDAQGRAVFVPPETGEVRFRAFSADGHGVDLKFDPPRGSQAAAPAADGERGAKLILGAGLLLTLFGIVQLFARREKTP
ncbi:MAG TPA: ABC transporter permease [Candidatus Desulfobacillus sp.]|nr:ABC transporter permease [Candidatus Desulfobacillus sp.]